ncbi:hypothetical protein [Burkholderia cenocepacia]|uniref:hypothetical protein n=1 Tax=Burkholderia cenocepacia TaxID=95486 RepID=UPI00187D59E0|nr:hypothetical protein [Burkholderia cenocepacia]MDN7624321.1 hypothetical protein [Burkholderia cenocepacia]QUN39423.1 hypothetical protein KEH56_00600 [Burkholderia cenocepacia]QUO28667.1 hypothetical protein KEH57_33390 [Burkholderia cenocepacia]
MSVEPGERRARVPFTCPSIERSKKFAGPTRAFTPMSHVSLRAASVWSTACGASNGNADSGLRDASPGCVVSQRAYSRLRDAASARSIASCPPRT